MHSATCWSSGHQLSPVDSQDLMESWRQQEAGPIKNAFQDRTATTGPTHTHRTRVANSLRSVRQHVALLGSRLLCLKCHERCQYTVHSHYPRAFQRVPVQFESPSAFESPWLIVTGILNIPEHRWLRLLLRGKHTRFLAGYSTTSNQQNCLLSKQDFHPPHRRASQMPVSNQLPRSQHLALATLTPRPLLSSPIHLFSASPT